MVSMVILNNSINKKTALEEKKPNAVKDRGSRVGLTAVKDSMVFF